MANREVEVTALLTAVKGGDNVAFAELLDMYRPMLTSRVRLFTDDGVEGKELFQEATLALYRAALSYREGRGVTFGAFARVCVANALVSARRRSRSAALLSLDQLCEEGAAPIAEVGDVAEDLITREEIAELCRVARATLSKYEMQVFLPYINGDSTRKIAEMVGKDEKSVANAIARALSKLRTQLQ